jgi:hypothetical protein
MHTTRLLLLAACLVPGLALAHHHHHHHHHHHGHHSTGFFGTSHSSSGDARECVRWENVVAPVADAGEDSDAGDPRLGDELAASDLVGDELLDVDDVAVDAGTCDCQPADAPRAVSELRSVADDAGTCECDAPSLDVETELEVDDAGTPVVLERRCVEYAPGFACSAVGGLAPIAAIALLGLRRRSKRAQPTCSA